MLMKKTTSKDKGTSLSEVKLKMFRDQPLSQEALPGSAKRKSQIGKGLLT